MSDDDIPPPLLGLSADNNADALEAAANRAFRRQDHAGAAAYAQAAAIYAMITVLERIENSLDGINATLAEIHPMPPE